MNRYMMISRLRWPAFLLLTGIIALLHQAHILSWGHGWPLYLILFGVLALAERAALASEPPPSYPYGSGYQAAGYPPAGSAYAGGYPPPPAAPVPGPGAAIVQAHSGPLEVPSTEFGSNREEEER
jgi:hypothetical protein